MILGRRDLAGLRPAATPSIEALRAQYRRRTPRMFYESCETGSYTGQTFAQNSAAFEKYKLRQRVGVNIADRTLATELLGQKATIPVALAPVGSLGMQWPDGEIHAAQAAQAFGVPFTLSTMSICSMEQVAAHTSTPFWFQLYVMRDRDFVRRLIRRARDVGCPTLVLTMDLQILAQRHNDLRNGLSVPPRLSLANILNMMTHLHWCGAMLATKNRRFGNVMGHVQGVANLVDLAQWIKTQFDPTLDWSVVDFIRQEWDGKLLLKGINDVQDAQIASQLGVDGIVVSNHGGRQLDGAPAAIDILGPIVDAVGHLTQVYFDSGIRTGMDVMRALALGAKAVFVGRAYVYGLGAGAGPGVVRALEIIRDELDTTMALCGETNIAEVGRHNLLSSAARGPGT